MQGRKRRVSEMDPSCSAGSYPSVNREDWKYQHLSQCASFFSLQLLVEPGRVSAAHWVSSRATSLAFICLSPEMRWSSPAFTNIHHAKTHLQIQNLWRMIREAGLVCDGFCRDQPPRTTIQPGFLSYKAEKNPVEFRPWRPGLRDSGLWSLLVLSDVIHEVSFVYWFVKSIFHKLLWIWPKRN